MSGTIALRIALIAAAMTIACDSNDVIIDDFGTAGYAIVQGNVVRPDGEPYAGSVFISCGLEGPGEFAHTFPVSPPGHYRAELEWPNAAQADALEAADWRGICRVSAPGGSPAFATATDTVVFAPTRSARVETTIDLDVGMGGATPRR